MNENLNKLIENLHNAQNNDNQKKIIKAQLELAQYHYNKSNYNKSKLLLTDILKKDNTTPNINYYLALIEIYSENISSAIEYLNNEIKNNPHYTQAKKLKEKLLIKNNFPYITLFFVFINIILFIINFPQITTINLIKYGISNYNFTIFSAITSIFIHLNWIHFIINTIILIIFGLILEKHIGSVKFFIIYLISGISANLIQAYLTPESIVLGASGAIFAILGALMIQQPLLKMKLLGIINIPIIILVSFFFTLSLADEILLTNNFISGNISHLVGILIGIFICGLYYKEKISIFYHWIFIIIGFWFIINTIKNLITFKIIFNINFIINIIIITFSILIIIYSYLQLKQKEEFIK